jgi:hypothetical protein
MTGEMFEGEFDMGGEVNESDFCEEELGGYLPDEFEPWFTDMCNELDEIFGDFLLD